MKKYQVGVEAYGDGCEVGVIASNKKEAKEKAIEWAMGNYTFTIYDPDFEGADYKVDYCLEVRKGDFTPRCLSDEYKEFEKAEKEKVNYA